MPSEAHHTAYILRFFNDVADALNGDYRDANGSRRIPWSDSSYHDEFLGKARTALMKMHFVDKKTKKKVSTDVPCLQNLIDTLQAFKLLWKKLKSLGFTSFFPRNLNQDPLENFFGNIKSHDFKSTKPTCLQFESTFKSMVITNLSSKHTPGYNCEEDDGKFILPSSYLLLRDLVNVDEFQENNNTEDERYRQDILQEEVCPIPEKAHFYSNSEDLIRSLQLLMPAVKSCSVCSKNFQEKSLRNPAHTRFRGLHLDAKRVLGRILSNNLSLKHLNEQAMQWLQPKLNSTFLTCQIHKTKLLIIFFNLCFIKYCKGILTYLNRVFRGKIIPQNQNLSPPVQKALSCYLKTLKKDKRSDITNPTQKNVIKADKNSNVPQIVIEKNFKC